MPGVWAILGDLRAAVVRTAQQGILMIISKLPNVGTTIFTQMSQLAVETGALNLSQGFPDFDGPQALRDACLLYTSPSPRDS